ncbi:hypothetical protein GCM10025869_22560 [Homoserinibacter gongjuensis]|uniref:Uncharacterized protein n=1 Tax=Homoserinibacter gongjuensis TaxID=1162968 RepID=A0ABQ6JYE9_9MICO|nr:hypothetical protein GCM10025869_22560 [Homoserinibacter gongjuensis]
MFAEPPGDAVTAPQLQVIRPFGAYAEFTVADTEGRPGVPCAVMLLAAEVPAAPCLPPEFTA